MIMMNADLKYQTRDIGNVIHIAGTHFSENIAKAASANGVDCVVFRTHNGKVFTIQVSVRGLREN